MADEITYNVLRNRQKEEDDEPGVTRLDADFYRRVRERIAALHEEYRQAQREDPADQRTRMLLDEINKMEDTLEELYHRRQRKIVRAAIARARGGDPGVENLTPPERDLFDSLVETLDDHKDRTLETEVEAPEPVEPETPPETEDEEAIDEPAEDDDGEPPETDDDGGAVERVMVRVLEDLEPFVATDMETYDLAEDDVVNLPVEQARVLCRRGKAIQLDED